MTPLSTCTQTHYTDSQNREVVIHHRLLDAPLNPQTDISELVPVIEKVEYKGRQVKLSKEGKETLNDFLNQINQAA